MGGDTVRTAVGGGDAGTAGDSRGGGGGKDQALGDTRHGKELLAVDTQTPGQGRPALCQRAALAGVVPPKE
nr:hypothetical protein StreXyl84_41730 [Streptomyces sp. Xyl84]